MGQSSKALEREVSAIREIKTAAEAQDRELTRREKQSIDSHFGALLNMLAGRIYHFTRLYGLMDMQDDARQACAIGVHRAITDYDPAQARFTTFVTWQLRGELQGLRHRVRLDQRDSAKTAGVRTISIEQQSGSGGDEAYMIADETAQIRTESGASQLMAARCANALLDEWEHAMRARDGGKSGNPLTQKLRAEREIVSSFLLGTPNRQLAGSMISEQERQITRRVVRHCAAQVIAA